MYCNLLLFRLSNNQWKNNDLSIQNVVKNLRNNQKLKLWSCVPIAVSSCPAAAYIYI